MNKGSFQNKVSWYNFILCIFVVWIHTQNTTRFTQEVLIDGQPLLSWIEQVIVSEIAVIGVAGFFLCSGYLFYRNYTWKKVFEKYRTRFLGLLLPYILWNLIYYFFHVLVSYVPILGATFQEEKISVTGASILDAILNYRYAQFLWFLQFLIIFVILAPILYVFISNRYMGLAAIVIVLVLNSTNGGLTANISIGNVQLTSLFNWLSVYMIGGYIGVHCRKAVEEDKVSWMLLIASFILMMFSYYFYKHVPSMFSNLMYFLLAAIFLWCVIAKLPLPNVARWQKNTFMVYLTHYVIVQGINSLISRYISSSMWVGIILFFILPGICFGLVTLFKKLCGNGQTIIWKILSGNR